MAKFDPSTLAQSKEKKGSNLAAHCSGAIVQKPRVPNAKDRKILLQPSGNQGTNNKFLTLTECFLANVSLSRINFRHTLYGYFYAKVVHGKQNMNTCKRRNKSIIGVQSSLLAVTGYSDSVNYTDSFLQRKIIKYISIE